MNKSVKPWGESDFIQFFGRHLVALCVAFEWKVTDETEQAPRFAAYSGTLIRVHDTTYFLTAGHILRDLDKALKSNQVEIKNAVLADTFGSQRVSDHPIPFDLKSAQMLYVDDDEEGLDYGVIPLGRYYVRLLGANGVVALEEQNWIHQPAVAFDGYVMFGLPEEFTSDRISASGDGRVAPTMFAVRRLASPPEGSKVTGRPRFIGQIDAELPLKSVKGMSGGPIFGFRLGSESRYWVVALQSSWDPTRRVVYGCLLPTLASLMTTSAKELVPTS